MRHTHESVIKYVTRHLCADSINQLQTAVQKFERDSEKLKSDNEELTEKNRSLQAALDNSYKY